MEVFGLEPWGPAVDGDCTMTATPVGWKCLRCEEPIAADDDGLIMPYAHAGPGGGRLVAQHRECFMREVLGSVGHQDKKCSCYGGTEEDPPGLTRREAAWAAVEFAEGRWWARYG